MNPEQVLQNGLTEVSHTKANSPVRVSLQFDHLVGTKETLNTTSLRCLQASHCKLQVLKPVNVSHLKIFQLPKHTLSFGIKMSKLCISTLEDKALNLHYPLCIMKNPIVLTGLAGNKISSHLGRDPSVK